MSQDPIVQEVRTIRDTYAKRFDYDTGAIYRDLKNQETQTGRKFISLPPKRVEPAKQKTA